MNPDDLVTCADCIRYRYPSEICYLENCIDAENGYCGHCPCNGCDIDCLDFDEPKPFKERPKFQDKNIKQEKLE